MSANAPWEAKWLAIGAAVLLLGPKLFGKSAAKSPGVNGASTSRSPVPGLSGGGGSGKSGGGVSAGGSSGGGGGAKGNLKPPSLTSPQGVSSYDKATAAALAYGAGDFGGGLNYGKADAAQLAAENALIFHGDAGPLLGIPAPDPNWSMVNDGVYSIPEMGGQPAPAPGAWSMPGVNYGIPDSAATPSVAEADASPDTQWHMPGVNYDGIYGPQDSIGQDVNAPQNMSDWEAAGGVSNDFSGFNDASGNMGDRSAFDWSNNNFDGFGGFDSSSWDMTAGANDGYVDVSDGN